MVCIKDMHTYANTKNTIVNKYQIGGMSVGQEAPLPQFQLPCPPPMAHIGGKVENLVKT